MYKAYTVHIKILQYNLINQRPLTDIHNVEKKNSFQFFGF